MNMIDIQPTRLRPRHGNRLEPRSLRPGEAAGLTIFLVIIFAIGTGLIIHRNKQLKRRDQAVRKREGKRAVAPKLSTRRPREHLALMERARNDAQASYLRYWSEPLPWSETLVSSDGIVLGTICNCDVCRAMLDGFS